MTNEAISLRELNTRVSDAVQRVFHSPVWVIAEISEMHTAGNGHCYLEFIEKDPRRGDITARARGAIWAGRYWLIASAFEQLTGQRLQAGIRVLIQVEVQMHEVYGYSLIVQDIDPSFTLGEMARRRQEIIRRLEDEGLTDMNKGIEMPTPTLRIAVISAGNAAGYGDFCRQLAENEWGIKFYTHLFPAVMQGQQTEASVIAALERVYAHHELFDAVAIIRGGGATADLSCFDSYELAVNIANFPLPVITGIGHDRDSTVIDVVAHTSVKTPTAAAALLIDMASIEVRLLDNYSQLVLDSNRNCLEKARLHLQHVCLKLQIPRQTIASHRHQLNLASATILHMVPMRLNSERVFLNQCEKIVGIANVQKTLQRGFAIARIDGKTIRHVADAPPGSRISLQTTDGTIDAIVEQK